MTITLYDITNSVAGQSWSPNTIKTRIVLNVKGLPFKTEWLEYPDIEPVLKKIGASPTSKKPDGRDHYTLPVIHDSTTGKVIADSFAIASYLDAAYPNTPALFPTGSVAAIALFDYHLVQSTAATGYSILAPSLWKQLNPVSAEYFRSNNEKRLGCKLEDLAPPGPKREEAYRKIKEVFDTIAGFLDKNGSAESYYLGETFTYADVILAAYLRCYRIFIDDEGWKTITGSNGKRWEEIARLAKE